MEVTDLQRRFKQLDQYYVPVEFRELEKPGEAAAQGVVEMWTEVLTLEDAPKIDP